MPSLFRSWSPNSLFASGGRSPPSSSRSRSSSSRSRSSSSRSRSSSSRSLSSWVTTASTSPSAPDS
ncbi:MAG TPA: hypothetical protein DCE55_14230 [Planctomycetaceae bacterium]|nr:hypothetical protein [Planctomycetaceae bacterium]